MISRRSSTASSEPSSPADPLTVAAQLAGQVLGLDHERAQPLGERIQMRVDAGERIQARGGSRHQLRASRTVGGILRGERVRAGARGGAQRVETTQASARGEKILVLALVEPRVVDLGQLVLEQAELALTGQGELTQGLELSREATGLGERLGAGAQAQRVIGAAEGIEDLQLGACEGQLAVLVLAVEGNESRAVFAQLGDGRRAAVDIGA